MSSFQSVLFFLGNLVTKGPVVLVGDFNLPDINWSSLSSQSAVSDEFCDFVFYHNLTQLVEEPTHITGNCLDLILINTPDNIDPIHITQESLIQSDHLVLSFTLSTTCRFQESRSLCSFVPDFSKLNYSDLCYQLFTADFSDCLLSTDTELILV